MTPTTITKRRNDTIQRQYEELQRLLARAPEIVESEHSNPVDVWDCFASLENAMKVHFAAEEVSGGLFDCLMADAPQFSRRIAELRAEHDMLRHMAFHLAQAATLLTSSKGPLPPEITQAFEEFVTTFHRHELKEDDLLQEVYSGDQAAMD